LYLFDLNFKAIIREHVEDPSEEEIEYCPPPEIQDKAHDVSLNLLPEKSRGKYQLQYTG
jgi:hypothetical protein